MRKQPLAYVGGFFILVGVVLLLLAMFGISALVAHLQWYVPHFFGPERPAANGYDQLYDFAVTEARLRGSAELRLYYILALSFAALGGVLVAWARDRKRLLQYAKPAA